MTKISFICPVFNKEKYLPKVLESIRNQVGDFKKEYIFINDGSTDNSLDLLKEGTKKWKNTTIINQTNKGPAKATQEGIHKSKGDFIDNQVESIDTLMVKVSKFYRHLKEN